MKTNLTFKSVTYKNFLATGNKEVTIPLDDKATTLIYGKNGAGKSTVYEALYYGLYGKAFRKANIPDLINNINNKHMEVRVSFNVQGIPFEVIRGKKPGKFEIWRAGKLLDQGSSVFDYQAKLERQILKMSPATFMQTVILGSLHYVPYMRIRKGKDRMAIIEELLDIQIFSQMNVVARKRMNSINRDIEEMHQKQTLLENSIGLVASHLTDIETKTDVQKKKSEEYLSQLKGDIVNTQTGIDTLTKDRDAIDLSVKEQYQKEKDKWSRLNTLAKKELQDSARDLKFFADSDSCDRCHQEIDIDFKLAEINKKSILQAQVQKAIETKIQPGMQAALDGLQHVQILNDELIELNNKIVEGRSQIDTLARQVKGLEDSLSEEGEKAHISEKRKELGRYKASLTKLTKKRLAYQVEIEEFDIVLKLLCDDGIKKNIIKMYIPVINKLISKYLSILGFPIKFTFDEDFKESIIVKGRRDLTYSSFSAGESMRVDLALLFAFREIPIIRSGNSCNLLIFDEVADSAMDSDGWDSFLTIINSISDVGNVFVISPRGDVLVEKFSKAISFSKQGQFSTLDPEK